LPAGPFIVGSYAFFLLLMVFYLWTIWRRINRVEKDLHDLARRQKDLAR
jgi:heme exporter protein CcmD